MNYNDLVDDKAVVGSIKHWANDSGLPSDEILAESQLNIYKRLLCRQMLQTQLGAIAQGDVSFTLPATYQAAFLLRWTGGVVGSTKAPERRPLDEVIDNWTYNSDGSRIQGTPRLYASDESTVQFSPAADQSYPYLFKFFGSLPLLGPNNQTNFLTNEYPTLLRTACLLRAAEFRKNMVEKQYWAQIFGAELMEANMSDDQERYGTDIDHDINP